jgi:diadenosine tetraphosphate (Ap4A) HIT family hydrolase
MTHDCPLCREDGGALIWRGARLRVIRADEAGFPAFYRVVWNAHVAEFSDLNAPERAHCMDVVAQVEAGLAPAPGSPPRSTLQRWATWCRTCTGM